jgi:SP family xylose:H+ symportor-like MFS transporter
MYIAEIAPASIRGKLVSWNQLAIVSGMLVVYFVNFAITRQGDTLWNEQTGWRWMFASSIIPATLFLVCLLFVPESPRWLVMQGREQKAADILGKLNAGVAIQEEIASIRSSVEKVVVKGIKLGWRIWVAGLLLSAFQQLIGIQVMLYYAPEIFKSMGQTTDSAMLQTILVGVVNVAFTVVAIYTVDKYGRKPLLMLGSVFMCVFMCILAVCFYTHNLGLMALVCVLGFVASFAFSWGPIVWVLLSEMFPNVVRSRLMSVAVAVQWITNYAVSSTFPLLDKNEWLLNTFNHAFSFGLFGIMAALSCVFAWKFIPETKGKTLEDMEQIWKIQTKINN